jgi:hypothetical protein
MPKKPANSRNIVIGVMIICVLVLTALIGLRVLLKSDPKSGIRKTAENVRIPSKSGSVLDFNRIEEDPTLKALMQKRKAKWGVGKGIDMITRSDESFKIGDLTVSMQEILDKIRLKSGDIVEKDLKPKHLKPEGNTATFGIYVVQSGDNIWNIHFNFLKDYFDHKGISLSPLADEPVKGESSAVGKLLKFSENTVNIYNLKEHKLDVDLNLIFPLTKVVVYNMDQIFAFLDLIDDEHVNHIQFDGETLWIPAK